MQIFEGCEQLPRHLPNLWLRIDFSFNFPAFEDLGKDGSYLMKITLGCVLHDDVDIVLIREELVKFDDMAMVNFTENLHL
jgi:hypothetical protein